MTKMISVVLDGETEYAIFYSDEKFQLTENGHIIFEDHYFRDVRDKLTELTGV
jgi:hypothetical protein